MSLTLTPSYQESHFAMAPGTFVKVKHSAVTGKGSVSCSKIGARDEFEHRGILPVRIQCQLAQEYWRKHSREKKAS
jgi:hypothetical protein